MTVKKYFKYIRIQYQLKKKLVFNILDPKKQNDFVFFILLCAPRTGSTLLHTYLNAHPNIHSYGEFLRVNSPDKWTKIIRPHSRLIKAVGLKLFYDYFHDDELKEICEQILNHKNCKIIHLRREDLLATYLSLCMAQKTQQWNDIKPLKTLENIKIEVDEFDTFCQNYIKQHQHFDAIFKNKAIFNLSYEELVNDPSKSLEEVQKFLKTSPRKLISLLYKQNKRSIKEVITNYDEVNALYQRKYKNWYKDPENKNI